MPGYMVSMPTDLHKRATEYADAAEITFSELVRAALLAFIGGSGGAETQKAQGGDEIAKFMTEANKIRATSAFPEHDQHLGSKQLAP